MLFGRDRTGLNTALNITAVAFLAAILAAFFGMPRYNYGHILSRIARLEAQAAALETGFTKINILAGPDENKRAAAIGQIDSIASGLKKLDQDLISFLEHLAANSAEIEAVSQRCITFHERTRGEPAVGPERSGFATASGSNSSPAVVRAAQAETSSKLPARKIAEMTFDGFWEYLRSGEVPSIPRGAVSEKLDPENLSLLRLFFSSYCACIEAINRSEQLLIEELAEKATKAGDYVEDGKGESPPELRTLNEGGIVHVKNLPGERRREFRFATAENPDLRRLDALRDQALTNLLVFVHAVVLP